MAANLHLEIATPERILLQETVEQVEVPGLEGMLGILPEHAPLLSSLGSGPLCYTTGGTKRCMAISGGLVEVTSERVRVLAERAEFADEINIQRAQDALRRANERLLQPTADLDVARALNALKRAQARVDASKLASK